MKKIIILLLGILLFTSCLKDEVPFSCAVYGKVTEAEYPYLPLQRVDVKLEDGKSTETNELGEYTITISNLEYREYKIYFSLGGYKSDHTITHKLNKSQEKISNFKLRK